MYVLPAKMQEVSKLVNEIQEKVDQTLDSLSELEPIKNGEGGLTIKMPSFKDRNYEVSFHSRVLVPDGAETWSNPSLISALEEAKSEIFNWCEIELEMPSFHKHFLLDY